MTPGCGAGRGRGCDRCLIPCEGWDVLIPPPPFTPTPHTTLPQVLCRGAAAISRVPANHEGPGQHRRYSQHLRYQGWHQVLNFRRRGHCQHYSQVGQRNRRVAIWESEVEVGSCLDSRAGAARQGGGRVTSSLRRHFHGWGSRHDSTLHKLSLRQQSHSWNKEVVWGRMMLYCQAPSEWQWLWLWLLIDAQAQPQL